MSGLNVGQPGAGLGTGLIADRKLLLTADKSRVVEADDPDGAFLLANPGTLIPGEDVARLGLDADGDKIRQKKAAPALPAEGNREAGAIAAAVKDKLKADWEVRVQAEVDKELDVVATDMEKVEARKSSGKAAAPKSKAERSTEAERNAAASALAQNRAPLLSREALIRRGDPVPGGPNAPKIEGEGDKRGKK